MDNRQNYGERYEGNDYQTSRAGRYSDYSQASRSNQAEDQGAGWAAAVVGTALLGLGGYLIYRGVAGSGNRSQRRGSQQSSQKGQGNAQRVRESITINKPATELYHYWRHLSNLSDIMSHLESVKEKTDTRSHWVARGPVGTSVEWDAEVTQDVENQLIAWKAVEDADVQNEGNVTFTEAPGGRGTEVRVNLTYHPPGGQLGSAVAKLFGEEPSQQLSDDLRRFKQRMETGVTATTQGQSSGR